MLETRHLRPHRNRFGIVAPYALERAAFHEKRSTNSRPIVDCHTFRIKHKRSFYGSTTREQRRNRKSRRCSQKLFSCCHSIAFAKKCIIILSNSQCRTHFTKPSLYFQNGECKPPVVHEEDYSSEYSIRIHEPEDFHISLDASVRRGAYLQQTH